MRSQLKFKNTQIVKLIEIEIELATEIKTNIQIREPRVAHIERRNHASRSYLKGESMKEELSETRKL